MTTATSSIVSTLVMVVTTSDPATNTATTPLTVIIMVVVAVLQVGARLCTHPDSKPLDVQTLLVASLVVVAKLVVVLVVVAFANLVVACVPTQLNGRWGFSNNKTTFMPTCHPKLPHTLNLTTLHHLTMSIIVKTSPLANTPNSWIIMIYIIINKTYITLTTLRPISSNILPHTTTLPMTMNIILIPKAMTTDPSAPPLSPYMTVFPTPRTSMLHILTLSP